MKKIHVDVYDQEILVFTSREDFNRWEKRNKVQDREDRHHELDCCTGMAGVLATEEGECHWFMFLTEPDLVTVCHESVHLAYMMLGMVGIQHDMNNHEALAYLTDFIFKSVANVLKVPVLFE